MILLTDRSYFNKGTSKKHPSASLPTNSQSSRTSVVAKVARLLAPSIWALFRGSNKSQNGGFTLIELVLMVAILGIMVVLYIESAGNLSNVAVDGACRKAQSDIRYAQQLAQSTGTAHGAQFTASGSYEIYQGSPGNPVNDPLKGQPMVEDLANFPGVVISTNNQIEFDAMGRPTMGADSRVRFVATSGAIRDVYVIDQTGAVVIDLIQAGTGCSCEVCNK